MRHGYLRIPAAGTFPMMDVTQPVSSHGDPCRNNRLANACLSAEISHLGASVNHEIFKIVFTRKEGVDLQTSAELAHCGCTSLASLVPQETQGNDEY